MMERNKKSRNRIKIQKKGKKDPVFKALRTAGKEKCWQALTGPPFAFPIFFPNDLFPSMLPIYFSYFP